MFGSALPLFKNSGFTLVELMISVGIITVMTAALIPNFNTYITNQNSIQAMEQVKSDLRSVQNKALTGTGYTASPVTTFWGIRFVPNSQTYSWQTFTVATPVAATCTTAANWTNAESSSKLTADINIRGPANPKCVFFSFANGDVSFYNGTSIVNCNTSACTINVGKTTDANCNNVTINAFGLIQNNGSQVGCTS